MNPATHHRICAEIQERNQREMVSAMQKIKEIREMLEEEAERSKGFAIELSEVERVRDELAKLCNYNERVMQELLQQRDELLAALEKLARLGNEPHYGSSIGNQIARDALSKVSAGSTARPPTPVGWSDTDWLKHLQEQQHPLAGLHINQGSFDAAADAYEAEYNARHNAALSGPASSAPLESTVMQRRVEDDKHRTAKAIPRKS